MSTELTSHERFTRMYQHKPADRVPINDGPWKSTLQRWVKEGMPADADWQDYCGVDRQVYLWGDVSPQYPKKTLEETDDYILRITEWGTTIKEWKHHGGVPEFINYTITDRDAWEKAKKRMTPNNTRINWDYLKNNYANWRNRGAWLEAYWWFGFDVTHSWATGFERVIMAFVEDPDWLSDMFNTYLDLNIAIFEEQWQRGYTFDVLNWPDDLGFKAHPFISVQQYRDLLKPVMKRAVDWAHAHGIYARLHSCGQVMPLVPEFVDIGIDCLNPLEIKAGMDPIALKKQFGDKLVFHGGLNAAVMHEFDKYAEEMKKYVPILKQNGGYILSSDHSVPDAVSLETYKKIVALAKEIGKY